MKNNSYLLQVDCARAKRGGHGKKTARMRSVEVDAELPHRESMLRPHLGNRKTDNGNFYKLLKRYLRSRIGQPWDTVYGELCGKLRRDRGPDWIAREWVESWVSQNVVVDAAGEVRDQPSDCRLFGDFYVHPDGTLQLAGKRKRAQYKHKPLVETHKIDGTVRYAKQNGIWYEVTLLPIPTVQELRAAVPRFIGDALNVEWQYPQGRVDVILKERALAQNEDDLQPKPYHKTAYELRTFSAAWGGLVYAASKRQINGDELTRAGLRNDPPAGC